MLLPDELTSKVVLPSLRSLMARELIDTHGFTQKEVADILGITQASVSHYLRGKRGNQFTIEPFEELEERARRLAAGLSRGDVSHHEVMAGLTDMSNHVKENLLLCDFHKEMEPGEDLQDCELCAPS